jgi:hypothetical protein
MQGLLSEAFVAEQTQHAVRPLLPPVSLDRAERILLERKSDIDA